MAKKAQIDAVRPVLEAADRTADVVETVLDKVDKVADKGTDVVETGLEKVADVVPDALDTAVHVSTKGGRKLAIFIRDPKTMAVSAVVLAALLGAGLGVAGYSLAVKRLKSKIQKEADLELESAISEMRRFYETKYKDGRFATPASAVEELLPEGVQETLKNYQGAHGSETVVLDEAQTEIALETDAVPEETEETLRAKGYTDAQIAEVLGTNQPAIDALREKMRSGTPVEITETHSNIFVDGHELEEFDYAAEVDKRNPDEPYIITHDEFMENENGFTQGTMTYYNGDDILTDDKDVPVPDIENIVGSEALTRFGYGSRDRNVVYVRNEKLETDFEITLSQGEFAKEVAGFQHSAPIRRFRRGDDE
jgi:hypothetical protein